MGTNYRNSCRDVGEAFKMFGGRFEGILMSGFGFWARAWLKVREEEIVGLESKWKWECKVRII